MAAHSVMVLGVTGMLGHQVFKGLRTSIVDTVGVARDKREGRDWASIPLFAGDDVVWGVDAQDLPTLASLLDERRPTVLVNCVGIVKQRREAKDALPSIAINAYLPHWLADRLERWGGRLIHFSTDCVFSGRKGAYTEGDLTDAEDLYGRTKALGEVTTPNALTLRTSIIGRELRGRRSLVEWFLAQRGGRVRGYRRAIYSGVTTTAMARLVEWLIREHPCLSGLYHVSAEPIDKYRLLVLANEAFGTQTEIEPDDEVVLDRSMRSDLFRERTGWVPQSWVSMIREMAVDPTPYEVWQAIAAGGKR